MNRTIELKEVSLVAGTSRDLISVNEMDPRAALSQAGEEDVSARRLFEKQKAMRRSRTLGHYYGKYGFDSLTHAKSILISPPNVAIDHLFPPYTMEKVQALSQRSDY